MKINFIFGSNSKNAGHLSQQHSNHTRTPSPTPYTLPEHYYIVNATTRPSLAHITAERERIRVEFYATYDVMTGVRIAATLGGFFGLMVFLVIYKSRGEKHETMKALKVRWRINSLLSSALIELTFHFRREKGSENSGSGRCCHTGGRGS